MELATYHDYTAIENKLRQKGFVNDKESGIICRYKIKEIIVDVMPIQGNVLGFRNRWYAEGFSNSILYSISQNEQVRLFDAPHFIAAKLDAFNDRGQNDGRTSSDFEDIVYILNNRTVIWKEMQATSVDVKTYLKEEFYRLLKSGDLYEWISAHLDFAEQKRPDFIVNGLKVFIEENSG